MSPLLSERNFLAIFGFEGYDPLNSSVSFENNTGFYDGFDAQGYYSVPLTPLLWASFLGLPSRPTRRLAVTEGERGALAVDIDSSILTPADLLIEQYESLSRDRESVAAGDSGTKTLPLSMLSEGFSPVVQPEVDVASSSGSESLASNPRKLIHRGSRGHFGRLSPQKQLKLAASVQRLIYRRLSYLQWLGANLIGGVDLGDNISAEKRVWQFLGMLPVKLLLILPIRLITWPLKLSRNLGKLVIYIVLPALLQFLETATQWLWRGAASPLERLWQAELPKRIKLLDTVPLIPWFMVMSVLVLATWIPGAIIRHLLLPFSTLLFAPVSAARRIQASSQAFLQRILGYRQGSAWVPASFAFALALVPVLAITASFWALVLPLAIGAVATYLPALVVFCAWVAQWPLIATLAIPLNAAITLFSANALVGLIGSYYAGTVVAGGALIGVSLAPSFAATASTLGLLLALTAMASTRVWDVLSDRWARWHRGGPLTSWVTRLKHRVVGGGASLASALGFSAYRKLDESDVTLTSYGNGDVHQPLNLVQGSGSTVVPRKASQDFVAECGDSIIVAGGFDHQTDRVAERHEAAPGNGTVAPLTPPSDSKSEGSDPPYDWWR